MSNKNKVEFGMSNVRFATYEVKDGAVVIGTPLHVPGAVSITLDAETEESKFFADDVVYYSDFTDNGESGELTMALFPDEFKLAYLPYVTLDDGGIAKLKGESSKPVCLVFEGKGDKEKRRHVLYNIALGAITREHKTVEEGKEVEVETIPVTLNGDNATGIVKVSYSEGDTGYADLFTTIPAPKLPTSEPESV